MEIQCNRLDLAYQMFQDEFEKKALEVLRSGWYVLGCEVEAFEKEFADFLGIRHCIGVGNGLDALIMAFHLLGIGSGDEVIVQGNTYIASVMGITKNGAVPVFAEPDEFYNLDAAKLESYITPKTKAILVVHLYGQASNMEAIMKIADKYGLKVVEDCAQSHGAMFKQRMTGTFGDIGCFSFYPTKNLGGFGDGGALVTYSDEIAAAAGIYRNYGSEKKYHNKVVGVNSRLDELQAGLLRVKLKHLNELNEERRRICKKYSEEIRNTRITLPYIRENAETVWHQYVVRCNNRKQLIEHLDKTGIHTMIHYPIPPHLSEAYRYLGVEKGTFPVTEQYAKEVLSLPLYNGMDEAEVMQVIKTLNNF